MTSAALKHLALERVLECAARGAASRGTCPCAIAGAVGWEKLPVSLPEGQLTAIGTLQLDPFEEPPFAEFHPSGTQYWSPDAPIALRHFPYNRCQVHECRACGRVCLGYTEAGGYYFEQRIRRLDPKLIVDVPLG